MPAIPAPLSGMLTGIFVAQPFRTWIFVGDSEKGSLGFLP
jgi:hypothetical protein